MVLPVSGDDVIKFAESVNEDIDRRFTKKSKSFYTLFNYTANTEDKFAGVQLGIKVSSKYDIYFNGFYNFRPYKNSLDGIDSDLEIKEKRSVFGLGLDKFFLISYDFGFYLNAGLAYTINRYFGMSLYNLGGFVPLVGGGVFYYLFDYVNIRIGYQYMRMPDVIDHWGQVSLVFIF